MVAWVDCVDRAPRRPRHPSGSRVGAETPEPHEQYLWDTGLHWGEWLRTGDAPRRRPLRELSPTRLRHRRHRLSSPTARARWLPNRADPRSRRRRGSLRGALRERAATRGRRSSSPTTAPCAPTRQANVRARARVRPRARRAARHRSPTSWWRLVRAADTHLGTGFLATPYLLPVLADTGHLDVAYELLFQDTPPSWLAMIDRGATTIWEHWEGVDADGVAARVAQPLQQGRGDLVPAPLRRRHPALGRRPRVPALPRRAAARRRPHVGERRARVAVRTHRVVMVDRRDRHDVRRAWCRRTPRPRSCCPTVASKWPDPDWPRSI